MDMKSKDSKHDPIPVWLLKQCFDILGPLLLQIVNKSLSLSYFPDKLKHAFVRPLIKDTSADKNVLKNYRPISNTAFLAKLIEKAALTQINTHVNGNDLHSPYQSGYRPHHSCETALLKLTADIQLAIDRKCMTALILLDLSAAFDTIDHDILINRLRSDFGFSGVGVGSLARSLCPRCRAL